MAVELPECPICKNKKHYYIMRHVSMNGENSLKPKIPPPPGAGVVRPAFEVESRKAVWYVCEDCRTMSVRWM